MENLILLFLIVFVSSVAQASTGFGFSILSMPFLLLIYDAHDAVLINIILSLLLSVVMAFRLRKEVDKKLLLQLIKGSLIGFLPGLLLFLYLDVKPLKIFISVLILLFSVLLLLQITMKRTARRSIAIGGISGFLTSSIGIPGPPLLAYFSGTKMNMHVVRSTTLSFFIVVYVISLLLHVSVSKVSSEVLLSSAYSIPFVLLGIIIGEVLFRKLKENMFHTILYVILAITGLGLLISMI